MTSLDELKQSDPFYMAWATEKEFAKYATNNYSEDYLLQVIKDNVLVVEKVVARISSEATNLQEICTLSKQRK